MSPAPNRLVSVVIPVYNGERYLGQTIESVLGQSHPHTELLVVDDGSEDCSARVAQAYGERIRYVRQEHGGQSAALNLGLSLARGGYLAFLDADDLWTGDKLARQFAAFDEHPDVDLLFCHVQQFVSPDLGEVNDRRLNCPSAPVPGYHQDALLTSRHVFERVGGFDTKWRAGQFMDWLLRVNDLGLQTLVLPDVLVRRRLHATNFGVVNPEARADYARVLKTALDRRRAPAGRPATQ
jgi:glycosyltransferase involved in cell wall biosynthesis